MSVSVILGIADIGLDVCARFTCVCASALPGELRANETIQRLKGEITNLTQIVEKQTGLAGKDNTVDELLKVSGVWWPPKAKSRWGGARELVRPELQTAYLNFSDHPFVIALRKAPPPITRVHFHCVTHASASGS